MISSRQQAYLEAIGIEVWSLRNQPAASETSACSTFGEGPGLRLASGDSGILLICEADIDSANRLANEIYCWSGAGLKFTDGSNIIDEKRFPDAVSRSTTSRANCLVSSE